MTEKVARQRLILLKQNYPHTPLNSSRDQYRSNCR
jgi:hypothetical protein